MSFRCDANLVGILYKNHAAILTCAKGFLSHMMAEDVVQMSDRRFLEMH